MEKVRSRIKTTVIIALLIVVIIQAVAHKIDQDIIRALAKSHADLHTAVEGFNRCIGGTTLERCQRAWLKPPPEDDETWMPK